jgi:hypothetical protein
MNMKKYSNRQEKKVAKSLNGRKTANSGATLFSKGDVATKYFLIECKTSITQKQSMSIKKEWLEKIEEEAFSMGKPYSTLAFNFGDNGENYFVIKEKLFKQFIKFLESEEENE